MKKKIILTGGSGFIGQRYLETESTVHHIQVVSLQKTKIEEIDFDGVKSIIHLAGIAHRMDQPKGDIYYNVNAHLAEKFALKAKNEGVPHFIYVSSVKVYGDSFSETEYDENSKCIPGDDYGKSKLLGEELLKKLEDANFKVAIVRPPLVYGPKVKGNMIRLMNLVSKNYYLPFKKIDNLRSMVFVDNLIALINTIITQKASGVFIAGDKRPISTSTLLEFIYKGLEKRNKCFSIPFIFRKAIELIKPSIYNRLFGSFVIDTTQTNQKLNFAPPHSTEFGIRKMVEWHQLNKK